MDAVRRFRPLPGLRRQDFHRDTKSHCRGSRCGSHAPADRGDSSASAILQCKLEVVSHVRRLTRMTLAASCSVEGMDGQLTGCNISCAIYAHIDLVRRHNGDMDLSTLEGRILGGRGRHGSVRYGKSRSQAETSPSTIQDIPHQYLFMMVTVSRSLRRLDRHSFICLHLGLALPFPCRSVEWKRVTLCQPEAPM